LSGPGVSVAQTTKNGIGWGLLRIFWNSLGPPPRISPRDFRVSPPRISRTGLLAGPKPLGPGGDTDRATRLLGPGRQAGRRFFFLGTFFFASNHKERGWETKLEGRGEERKGGDKIFRQEQRRRRTKGSRPQGQWGGRGGGARARGQSFFRWGLGGGPRSRGGVWPDLTRKPGASPPLVPTLFRPRYARRLFQKTGERRGRANRTRPLSPKTRGQKQKKKRTSKPKKKKRKKQSDLLLEISCIFGERRDPRGLLCGTPGPGEASGRPRSLGWNFSVFFFFFFSLRWAHRRGAPGNREHTGFVSFGGGRAPAAPRTPRRREEVRPRCSPRRNRGKERGGREGETGKEGKGKERGGKGGGEVDGEKRKKGGGGEGGGGTDEGGRVRHTLGSGSVGVSYWGGGGGFASGPQKAKGARAGSLVSRPRTKKTTGSEKKKGFGKSAPAKRNRGLGRGRGAWDRECSCARGAGAA